MKKKILIPIIILITLLLILFGYKLITYYRYTFPKPDTVEDVVKGYKKVNNYTISKKKLSEKEYIKVDHIKMRNILDGYTLEKSTDKYITYKTKKDDKEYTIQFNSPDINIIMTKAFVSDITLIYGDEKTSFFKGDIKDADREGFLKRNNIKNDIDFYKFIGDNYFIESSIFDNTATLKQNYAFNLFVESAIPQIDSWTILDGDIKGYIFNIGTNKDNPAFQVYILANDKQYSILTNDPRFKDDTFMIDVISTVVIE